MMSSSDVYAILGIAPTLDPAEIERAYQTQLSRHPPSDDPQEFQRLRAAYQSLQAPGALGAAFAAAPLDVEAAAAPYRQRFDAALTRERRRSFPAEERGQRFFALIAQLSYADAKKRLA